MKKIFTLITAAFAAVSVSAQDWNATNSDALLKGATLLDNDYATVVTGVQATSAALIKNASDASDPKTYAGYTFTKYVNIRVTDAPAEANNYEGSVFGDATPSAISLIVTAKENVDMTLYYKHGDGKAVSCYDQTKKESVAISETAVAGLSGYYTGTYKFQKDHVYTIYATGGTTGLNGISTAEGTYVEPTSKVYSNLTNTNLVTYNDGATMQISGNTGKNFGKGANITVGTAAYAGIKNSNGAQNTFTAATGKKIYRMTFYVIPNADGNTPKLSEFAGVAVDQTVTSVKDGANPTKIIECLNGAESATFTFSSAQVNFVVDVDYSENSYDEQYDVTLANAIESVKEVNGAAPAVKKFVKDGKLVIVNGNAEYNAAGAQIK